MSEHKTYFKQPRIVDKKHRASVSSRPCCICNAPPPNICHHIYAGGVGTKCSDYDTVALCVFCHAKVHATGRKDENYLTGGKLKGE